MNLDSGRLVAVNAQVTHAACLDDPRYVERFFDRLIERIGMKPLTAPMSIVIPPDPKNVGDQHADDGGMTTQCIISTSHIAYHSWPLQNRFRLVVDSCKDFETRSVLGTVTEWFPVNKLSVQDCCYEPPEVLCGEAEEATEQETEEVALDAAPT